MIRTRALLPYCIVSGSMALGYGSIYTLLADLRDRFGFTGTQLGLIVAAGFFAGFFAQLFLARYADRGHIALMVRGGVIVAGLAMIASAVATEFWAFLLARLLLGLGSGIVGPAIRRIVITRDPEHVGANLGRVASFDVAGFVLGPLLAAVTAEALGIRAPFWFLAAVFVVILTLTLRLDLSAGTRHRTTTGHPRAPRDPRDASDARHRGRVLRHHRHVRSHLGGAPARPGRRDLADRPDPVAVHDSDDLPRADRWAHRPSTTDHSASLPSASPSRPSAPSRTASSRRLDAARRLARPRGRRLLHHAREPGLRRARQPTRSSSRPRRASSARPVSPPPASPGSAPATSTSSQDASPCPSPPPR